MGKDLDVHFVGLESEGAEMWLLVAVVEDELQLMPITSTTRSPTFIYIHGRFHLTITI